MDFKHKRPEICKAIKNRNQISFRYDGKFRKGNPQRYGVNLKGNEVLRVHLIEGGKVPEQTFLTDNLNDFIILSERFTRPGPNYRIGDKDMIHIFCDLGDPDDW
jgi:hypothetical protein